TAPPIAASTYFPPSSRDRTLGSGRVRAYRNGPFAMPAYSGFGCDALAIFTRRSTASPAFVRSLMSVATTRLSCTRKTEALASRVLRVVPLVVDVPLHEGLHVDPELHVLEHLLKRVVLRLDERVRHADDRLDVVVDRAGRPVAARVKRRGRLAVLKEFRHAAFLVQVATSGFDALVVGLVIRDRVLEGRIVDDVDQLGPDLHPDALRRDERLAGLGGLPPEDPVRLRRMAARLVRGDPSDLGPGHQIHLALRRLLPFGQGLVHGAGLLDHAVGEAPRRDAFPAAGPSVVASRLFDGGP